MVFSTVIEQSIEVKIIDLSMILKQHTKHVKYQETKRKYKEHNSTKTQN